MLKWLLNWKKNFTTKFFSSTKYFFGALTKFGYLFIVPKKCFCYTEKNGYWKVDIQMGDIHP